MKIALKLFDKQGKVVYELPEAPKESGDATMLTRGGLYYTYAGLYGMGPGNKPYAKFVQSDAPLSLD